jgi:hypothetical protein
MVRLERRVERMSSPGERLRDRLTTELPQTLPRLTDFPSGSFMIDLNLDQEIYVIEHVVGQGFGLSAQKTATFGWEGVAQTFATVEALEAAVKSLVSKRR